MNEWELERKKVLDQFTELLAQVTMDGSKKRQRGEKDPWWKDGHENAMRRHLIRWALGELHDPDSGAHPLVHVAWRALAIAYQETYGMVEPK